MELATNCRLFTLSWDGVSLHGLTVPLVSTLICGDGCANKCLSKPPTISVGGDLLKDTPSGGEVSIALFLELVDGISMLMVVSVFPRLAMCWMSGISELGTIGVGSTAGVVCIGVDSVELPYGRQCCHHLRSP